MGSYVLLERDEVNQEIFVDYVWEKKSDTYYVHVNFGEELYSTKPYKQDAIESFYYISMLLCAYYDTHGIEDFIKAVKNYVSEQSSSPIAYDTSNAKINTVQTLMGK